MFPLIAMVIFVLIALLGLFHVLIVKATAWGFVAWFVILVVYNMTRKEGTKSRETDQAERIVPSGLGSDVSISNTGTMIENTIVFGDYNDGKTRERMMSYHGRETRKTLALMKDIEGELEERGNPTCRAIPWGFSTKEVTEGLAAIGSALSPKGEAGPSDDRYEAVVTYPMMEQEL